MSKCIAHLGVIVGVGIVGSAFLSALPRSFHIVRRTLHDAPSGPDPTRQRAPTTEPAALLCYITVHGCGRRRDGPGAQRSMFNAQRSVLGPLFDGSLVPSCPFRAKTFAHIPGPALASTLIVTCPQTNVQYYSNAQFTRRARRRTEVDILCRSSSPIVATSTYATWSWRVTHSVSALRCSGTLPGWDCVSENVSLPIPQHGTVALVKNVLLLSGSLSVLYLPLIL